MVPARAQFAEPLHFDPKQRTKLASQLERSEQARPFEKEFLEGRIRRSNGRAPACAGDFDEESAISQRRRGGEP